MKDLAGGRGWGRLARVRSPESVVCYQQAADGSFMGWGSGWPGHNLIKILFAELGNKSPVFSGSG